MPLEVDSDEMRKAFAAQRIKGMQRSVNADGTASWQRMPAAGVAVAVLDTGVSPRGDFAPGTLLDGYNCINPGAAALDDNGHGTMVAGIIAAAANGVGIAGVAPGTRIVPVKVLDGAGSGSMASVACGLEWVLTNMHRLNIGVVNLSLGGSAGDGTLQPCTSDPQHLAICQLRAAGVLVVTAAGNNASDIKYYQPAASPETLVVTAMADSDGLPYGTGRATGCTWPSTGAYMHLRDDIAACFSNYATLDRDRGRVLAAPGFKIRSTFPDGSVRQLSGTSMAAPFVSAAAALCMTYGPCPAFPPPCPSLGAANVNATVVALLGAAARRAAQSNRDCTSSAAARAACNGMLTDGFVGDPYAPLSLTAQSFTDGVPSADPAGGAALSPSYGHLLTLAELGVR